MDAPGWTEAGGIQFLDLAAEICYPGADIWYLGWSDGGIWYPDWSEDGIWYPSLCGFAPWRELTQSPGLI